MGIDAKNKRVVLIHEDDVGMSHGANTAFLELSKFGTCSSGSVMVPCPWFPEASYIAKSNPSLDLGVHLTLTSEMGPYKWRPVTGRSNKGGLTDESGCFWPDVPSVRQFADPKVVDAELRAQVDIALAAGIDVTHLDAHMGTALCPEFIEIYVQIARDYKLPCLLVKDFTTYGPYSYSGPLSTARYDAVLAQAKADGFPIFDLVIESPWERGKDIDAEYARFFDQIQIGLTYMAMHFNAPGEFESIEPELAFIRIEEYELFKSEKVKGWIKERDLEVIGWKQIRDQLRKQVFKS